MDKLFDDIKPSKGKKYSQNIYRWLNKHWSNRDNFPEAWEVGRHIWIGTKETDNRFSGRTLMTILCHGSSAEKFCNLGEGWWKDAKNITKEFWEAYKKDGRCAIDKDHKEYFIGDDTRWETKGKKRKCLWCGKVDQKLVTKIRKIEDKSWVIVERTQSEIMAKLNEVKG